MTLKFHTAEYSALQNSVNEIADLLNKSNGHHETVNFIILDYVLQRGIEEAREGYGLMVDIYEKELREVFGLVYQLTPEEYAARIPKEFTSWRD